MKIVKILQLSTPAHLRNSPAIMDAVCLCTMCATTQMTVEITAMSMAVPSQPVTQPQSSPVLMDAASVRLLCVMESITAKTMAPRMKLTAVSVVFFFFFSIFIYCYSIY